MNTQGFHHHILKRCYARSHAGLMQLPRYQQRHLTTLDLKADIAGAQGALRYTGFGVMLCGARR